MIDRRLRTFEDLETLRFGPDGLLPVVAQDADSGEVLMLAYADKLALQRTLETGEVHYYSRSRGELWRKGATSGNVQALVSLHADCDGDAVLARVTSPGPACHTGDRSCFGSASQNTLAQLWSRLQDRARERPSGSYTARLLSEENLRVKKLGEEVAELVLALGKQDPERIREEAADLLYHLLVALLGAGSSLNEVTRSLRVRMG